MRPGSKYDVWSAERGVRHRAPIGTKRPQPFEFTFGYLHPEGHCPHTPPCTDLTAKPAGGNEDGSRCFPQPKQARAHASLADILFYGGAVGGGKAIRTDTPIPTPRGFVTMGDLRVGDMVLDELGQPCRVTWKSDPHVDPTGTYRLTFDDGSAIVAGGQHKWWTITNDERTQGQRRNEAFRARRRATRPRRGTGRRPEMAARNAARALLTPKLEPSTGGIRTTEEIAATVDCENGRNHAVPLAGAWQLPTADLPINPYVLGVWLGDGTSANGGLTSDDAEIVDAVRAAGYKVRALDVPQHFYVSGLLVQLRTLGVLKNKHVPDAYLWASAEQRLAILQGLMDTDGCANADGQAEFCSTKRVLADAVLHLAASLGCKPTLTEGTAKLYGRVIGPKWMVKWTGTVPVFRLTRKLARLKSRVRSTQSRRYIVACDRVEDAIVQCIAVDSPTHLYLAGQAGIPTHNSEYAIVEAVTLCLEYRYCKVAIFRRTLTQLEQELEGRIILLTWADNKAIRGPNGKLFCKYNRQRHVFTFWNGSELHLCFCNNERDVYKYQSFQIIGLFIDESSHFTEFMVMYLITRVRSARRGVPKVIRLTSNPGNVGHGWHKRWFIRPTSEELGGRLLPQPFEIWRPLPRAKDPTPPERMLTRQFIPAWFHDNFALHEADPDYLAKVWALGGDKGKQLAEGDWDANESMICGSVWRERHRVTETDGILLDQGLKVNSVIPWHVFPNAHWRPKLGSNIFGSVDYGYGAPWSFHLHAALPGGHTRTFFEFYGPRVRDVHQAQRIWKALNEQTFDDNKTPLLQGLQWIVYDPAMGGSRAEMGIAKSIIEVYQDQTQHKIQFMPGAGGRPARTSRPGRWLDALSTSPDGFPHWSCTTACPDLIRTVPEVPWEEVDGHPGEVEDDKAESHAYEDTGRFFEARPHAARTEAPDPFEHMKDDPISKAHNEMLARRYEKKPASFDISNMVSR